MSEVTIRTDNRLSTQPNELLDRSQTIHFTFNGKRYPAYPGDTIASALLAAGIKVWGRSFKYHRPRGAIAFGHAASSMMQIDNEPSVSAWLRKVEDGMVIRSVNVWPSVDRDIMSLTAYGDRLTPVGFYYKTFIRPQALWPTYEAMLRRMAGLGRIDIHAEHPHGYYKEYLHGDVAVVGAGPAGLAAAAKAAESGARVLLFDEQPFLGGHLRYRRQGQEELKALSARVEGNKNITIYTETLVQSWFEDNWLAAVQGKCLYKVRAKQVIVATGALEQPLVFDNNDRPGIMMGNAVQRLLHLYGVVPGREAVVVTANDDGWRVAKDLQAAGVRVAMVADARAATETTVADDSLPVKWQHTIIDVKGKKGVTAAVLAPISHDGTVSTKAASTVACDFVPVSVAWAPFNGLLYQAGAKIAYDDERREFLPTALPLNVHAAGRVVGTHNLANQIAEGELAAQSALDALNATDPMAAISFAQLAARKAAEPIRTGAFLHIPGKGKQFVDLDEDVTSKDVKTAIAEGYDSIELLKRSWRQPGRVSR